MRKISLRNLSDPFRAFYQHGRWHDYASLLEEKGVLWLFECKWEKLAQHVQPLNFLQPHCKWTERLCFLRLCSDMRQSYADFSDYADYFVKIDDPVAAAATACTVIERVFYSGNNLHVLPEWGERIAFLLRQYSYQPVCQASLLSSKAIVSLFAEYDSNAVLRLTDESNSVLFFEDMHLKVIVLKNALLRCYALLYQGRLSEMNALLKESEPLVDGDQRTAYLALQFDLLRALCALYFPEKKNDALNIARKNALCPSCFLAPATLRFFHLAEHPFSQCPPHPSGLVDHINASASVPTGRAAFAPNSFGEMSRNAFACFLRHYFSSIFYRVTSQLPASLEHAQNALRYAGMCQSPFVSGLAVLLQAQSMAETGDDENCMTLLLGILENQPNTGRDYLGICAALELASLHLRKADRQKALHYYDLGTEQGALGEDFVILGRSREYFPGLRDQLLPSRSHLWTWISGQPAPLRLTTLGEFSFSIAGKCLYDRIWRNTKAKLLLKALIAHGGTKVAQEALQDVVWPDADGDQAAASLKSTTSRLRKIVNYFHPKTSNWLMISEGRFSLVTALCFVDALRFEAAIKEWEHAEGDIDHLGAVLSMYTGDFLASDPNLPWIATPRIRLRNLFRQGVVTLAQECMQAGRYELALNWLQRVEQVSVPSERIFALQMEIFMHLGYSADALQVFQEAKRFLQEELNTVPGKALQCLARKAGAHASD